MGNQHGLDFLTRACHTAISIWQDQSTTYMVAHKRVPVELKYSPIRKRPLLRALRHSKAYLNTGGGT
ncbi:ALG-2 interacting X [Gossypium arboreum]|uniref:ALG-2 interacting X n=1 Tax=Gossypium arboreum TaxID=29729 RepID=A0A0B0N683_GOSAR|nr:ALG-2 interacting X [Gossypium arboreum]